MQLLTPQYEEYAKQIADKAEKEAGIVIRNLISKLKLADEQLRQDDEFDYWGR